MAALVNMSTAYIEWWIQAKQVLSLHVLPGEWKKISKLKKANSSYTAAFESNNLNQVTPVTPEPQRTETGGVDTWTQSESDHEEPR